MSKSIVSMCTGIISISKSTLSMCTGIISISKSILSMCTGIFSISKGILRSSMLGLLIFCTLTAGCTWQAQVRERDSRIQRADQVAERRHQAFRDMTASNKQRRQLQRVSRPWIVGSSVPLAKEVKLPPALREKVDTTLMYASGKADLVTLAERITHATGIPVRVRPDALLPAEQFLPRLSGTSVPSQVASPWQASFGRGKQPLSKLLDTISRRLGVNWRFVTDHIEFYRTQTRVFDVRSLTLSSQADVKLGRSASAKTGGFENTSKTSLQSSSQHLAESIRARLEPFLTRAGTLVVHDASAHSIVVTDIPEVLDAIAQFIDRENRSMTRRVRLVFEEITVMAHDHVEFGIDWEAVFSGVKVAASLASPVGVSNPSLGRAGVSLSHPSMETSRLLLKAVAKYGKVLRHATIPVLTLNRRPVTHAVRTTFSYIDKVQAGTQPGASLRADGLTPTTSISQKEETVGAFLTLVPDAQEDGQILLSVAYDNTVAQPIKTVTFGSATGKVDIQQITIDGNGTVQQVALRSGQPMLIAGFEKNHQSTSNNRVLPGAPLLAGGSEKAEMDRVATLILVRALVEEGI